MKNMLKGKTPSLIGFSNGRPKRVVVQRKSECCRCKQDILPGVDCFDIPQKSAGFTRECRHCKNCYEKILNQTQEDLTSLKSL
jgi:hypothetical protein